MTVALHEGNALPDKITFAKALADASLLPKQYQRQPANVLVAIEYGEALGIRPMVAINEINVINGTPSLSASLMVALARQAGHKVRVSGDDRSATCEIVRADDPEYTHKATWDEKKAKDAQLWGRGHWSKDPGTMLKWRAISECVRFACSEVLGGLKYTPEEILDFAPQQAQSQVRQAPAEPVAEASDSRTPAQARKLAVVMKEAGLDNRDEALAYFQGIIGREIGSTKELTKVECSKIIDQLSEANNAGVDVQTGEIVEDAEVVEAVPDPVVAANVDPWAEPQR